MAWATLAGYGVIEARIELPRLGAWTADVAVDTDTPPTGAVTLDLNGFQLQGTVLRGGMVADTSILRLVGGAGGLDTLLDPTAYNAVPLQVPLSDALQAGGEVLAPNSDQALLGATLDSWVRMQCTVGAAVAQLVAKQAGAAWRTLANGQVWAGGETWPTSQLQESDALLLRQDPSNGREVFFADTPALVPGTVFRGNRVSAVEHIIGREELRMVAWYE